MYVVAAGIQGARTRHRVRSSRKEFSLDAAAVLQAVTRTLSSFSSAQPNTRPGPAGSRRVCCLSSNRSPSRAVVIIDEAYVDYLTCQPSLSAEIPANPNLVVLRTLSKAYGLAGAASAQLIADPR